MTALGLYINNMSCVVMVYNINLYIYSVLGSCWLHDMFQCYVFKVYSDETDTRSFIVKESAGFSYQSFFKMYSLILQRVSVFGKMLYLLVL